MKKIDDSNEVKTRESVRIPKIKEEILLLIFGAAFAALYHVLTGIGPADLGDLIANEWKSGNGSKAVFLAIDRYTTPFGLAIWIRYLIGSTRFDKHIATRKFCFDEVKR